MPKVDTDRLELVTNSDLGLLRVSTAFVESAAIAFGLAENETLALTLAVEEIFVYLCDIIPQKDVVRINVLGKGYQVETEFIFSSDDFDLHAFNLGCVPDHSGADECNDETGLIIASRMVDSFSLDQSGSKLRLKLVKEKYYPEIDQLAGANPVLKGKFHIEEANPEQMKDLIRVVSVNYPKINVPDAFRFPGKLIDMALRGYYRIAVALDEAGTIAGGLVWKWESERLVTFRGPFLLAECKDQDISQRLVDFLLERVARTNAIGVMSMWPTSDLPVGMFEKLGSHYFFEHDQRTEVNAYFRHLDEDYGSVIVVHSCISEFVKRKYEELFLARNVESLVYTGETKQAHSVISTKIFRNFNKVTLRPVIYGHDAAENLRAHLNLLISDGIPNIFFDMDLGFPDYSMFAPALLECSFEPCYLVPMAGKSDTVVFQYIPGGMH